MEKLARPLDVVLKLFRSLMKRSQVVIYLLQLFDILRLDLLALVLHGFARCGELRGPDVSDSLLRLLNVLFLVPLTKDEELIVNTQLNILRRVEPHVGLLLVFLFPSGAHSIIGFALLLHSVHQSEVLGMSLVDSDGNLLLVHTVLEDFRESV